MILIVKTSQSQVPNTTDKILWAAPNTTTAMAVKAQHDKISCRVLLRTRISEFLAYICFSLKVKSNIKVALL